jgi:DNA replication protein DnaC
MGEFLVKVRHLPGRSAITGSGTSPIAFVPGCPSGTPTSSAPAPTTMRSTFQKQMAGYKLLIIDELGFVPLSKTGAELLFELISQRYERGSTLITSNLPFDEWTQTFGSERLTGALLDRLTHHVSILEMNGDSYRLAQSRARKTANPHQ